MWDKKGAAIESDGIQPNPSSNPNNNSNPNSLPFENPKTFSFDLYPSPVPSCRLGLGFFRRQWRAGRWATMLNWSPRLFSSSTSSFTSIWRRTLEAATSRSRRRPRPRDPPSSFQSAALFGFSICSITMSIPTSRRSSVRSSSLTPRFDFVLILNFQSFVCVG